jgi:hypothetical protein
MRRVITYITLISTLLLFTACSGSPYRQVKPSELIESGALSIVIPDRNWKIPKGYNKEKYKKKTALPHIYHLTQNMKFSIHTYDYKARIAQKQFFNKAAKYRDTDIDGEEAFTQNDKETGISYRKRWVSYLNDMKCQGGVYSRGFGGSYYSGGVKFYTIICGYYDTTETKNDGQRMLSINYRYTHNTKTTEGIQREKTVKQAVKKAISTLKIKNIDIPRMEKEGLMHYDKVFESTKW